MIIQIENTNISADLIERFFVCDLSQCRGLCCVEGEAGAPLDKGEYDILRRILPAVWDDLSPEAKEVINRQGVGYVDAESDLVTSIVNGKHCVFACRDADGTCGCAIEKAYGERRIGFMKPVSCHLYPVHVTQYKDYKAVNLHRWKICRMAEMRGAQKRIRAYQFLREPLIRKFGEEWYNALDACAKEYFKV